MVLDQRITKLTADLARGATAAPLSPQRLARLLTLNQELMEVLTTADKAQRGGLDLTGDLWPERDDDEETDMDQQHMLMLIDALEQVGLNPQARPDALARANQYFAGNEVQEWEARDFAQSLRKDAPHLFRQQASAPASAPSGTTGYSQGKRREPPQPLRAVSQACDVLPPMERLAKLQTWQAEQKPNA